MEGLSWPRQEGRRYLRIDDLIAQRRRTSDQTWDSEIMCRRPRRTSTVYPNFDADRHVQPLPPIADHDELIGGVYFWLRSPLVILWARLTGSSDNVGDRTLEVVDEHVGNGLTLAQHITRIQDQGWPRPIWLGVDPAGAQRNSQTGHRYIQILRRHGYQVRACRSDICTGVERLRHRMDHACAAIPDNQPEIGRSKRKHWQVCAGLIKIAGPSWPGSLHG